jgi:glycerol-3-phosphate dehydrogenase (NAD(P)+)
MRLPLFLAEIFLTAGLGGGNGDFFKMANIVILGAGVMGSALSIPLSDNGNNVRLVGTHLDGDIIEEIHQSRVHPNLRVAIPDPVQAIPVAGLAEALQGADLVILGVSSPGVRWAAQILAPLLPEGVPVLMVTKGLATEGGRLKILPQVFAELVERRGAPGVEVAALGGPSIARELALRQPTCVYVAGENLPLVETMGRILGGQYYHLWPSTDLVGVEVCVALKNAYALGVGMVLDAGQATDAVPAYNPAAAVFAQSLSEIAYLVEFMGGKLESVLSLPGAGDLYVTCHGGRNSRMGRWLGKGVSYREAKVRHMPGETVEGAELLLEIGPTIEDLVETQMLDGRRIPLLRALYRILREEAPASIPWETFFLAPRPD